jgi:hypothetical protein
VAASHSNPFPACSISRDDETESLRIGRIWSLLIYSAAQVLRRSGNLDAIRYEILQCGGQGQPLVRAASMRRIGQRGCPN